MRIKVPWWLWPWPQAKRTQAHIAVINGLDEQEVERQVDRALTKSAQSKAAH